MLPEDTLIEIFASYIFFQISFSGSNMKTLINKSGVFLPITTSGWRLTWLKLHTGMEGSESRQNCESVAVWLWRYLVIHCK